MNSCFLSFNFASDTKLTKEMSWRKANTFQMVGRKIYWKKNYLSFFFLILFFFATPWNKQVRKSNSVKRQIGFWYETIACESVVPIIMKHETWSCAKSANWIRTFFLQTLPYVLATTAAMHTVTKYDISFSPKVDKIWFTATFLDLKMKKVQF